MAYHDPPSIIRTAHHYYWFTFRLKILSSVQSLLFLCFVQSTPSETEIGRGRDGHQRSEKESVTLKWQHSDPGESFLLGEKRTFPRPSITGQASTWPRMESDHGPPGPLGGQQLTSNGAPHVRRLRTLKRKKEEKEMNRNQVKLDRVLGLTVTSNASLATAPATGE